MCLIWTQWTNWVIPAPRRVFHGLGPLDKCVALLLLVVNLVVVRSLEVVVDGVFAQRLWQSHFYAFAGSHVENTSFFLVPEFVTLPTNVIRFDEFHRPYREHDHLHKLKSEQHG